MPPFPEREPETGGRKHEGCFTAYCFDSQAVFICVGVYIYICVCVFIFPPLPTFWLSVSMDMWHPSDLHCLKPAHWLLFVRFRSHFRRLTSLSGLGSDTKRIWGCRVKVTHKGLVCFVVRSQGCRQFGGSSKRAQYNPLYNEWNLVYRMLWQRTVNFIVVLQYAKSCKMCVAI